jgi:hypothetical protein
VCIVCMRRAEASIGARIRTMAANYFVLMRNIEKDRLSEQVRAYCLALCGESKLGALNTPAPAMGAAVSRFGAFGEVPRYHKLFLPKARGDGLLTERAVRFACRNVSKTDLVVFPDLDRAKVFAQCVNLAKQPEVVMNCPRRLQRLPENALNTHLSLGEACRLPCRPVPGMAGH